MLAQQGGRCDGAVALPLVDLEWDRAFTFQHLPGDAGCCWSRDRGLRASVTEGGDGLELLRAGLLQEAS